jgi:hypothetical protein
VIHFDPTRARESLAHYSVRWLQQVRPPFTGEKEPRYWQSDRDRYLWYTDAGGSMVVRLRLLSTALLTAERRFYTSVAGAEAPEDPTSFGMPALPWLSRSP